MNAKSATILGSNNGWQEAHTANVRHQPRAASCASAACRCWASIALAAVAIEEICLHLQGQIYCERLAQSGEVAVALVRRVKDLVLIADLLDVSKTVDVRIGNLNAQRRLSRSKGPPTIDILGVLGRRLWGATHPWMRSVLGTENGTPRLRNLQCRARISPRTRSSSFGRPSVMAGYDDDGIVLA